ncbi:DNRLRE domain-containing protein [Brevibacillus laterosporus]|uniref:DNRLRE domain-containing protein n=1 Tax=Brevibacillus laterosporus TaxID=1465 RepID=UPI003D1F7090
MHVMKGLFLSLHASLADKGLSRGINTPPTTQWHDLSGKGNHGVLKGFSFEPESGWAGNNSLPDPYSLYFDGYNDYVDCGEAIVPISSVTFEAWFYYVGGNVVLSFGGQLENTQGFSIVFNDKGELELYVKTASKKAVLNLGVKSRLEWYHVAGSYDEATGYFSVYLNGAPNGRIKATDGTFTTPPTRLVIGRHNTENSQWFRGAIPVIRVYDRALSMDEVGKNYLSGYLLHRAEKNLSSHINVPNAVNLSSSLRVSIEGKVRGSYDVTPASVVDTKSYIIVKRPVDLSSSAYVNPNTALHGNYNIGVIEKSNLEGSISVKKPSNLHSIITITPHTKVSVRYGMEQLFINDLDSSVNVNQAGTLPSAIYVPPISKVTTSYKVQGITISDLRSFVIVKGSGNLAGNIKVSSRNIVTSRYNIQGISNTDLLSNLNISTVSHLQSTIRIKSHTKLVGNYRLIVGEVGDLQSLLTIASTSNLVSNVKIAPHAIMKVKYGVLAGGLKDLPSTLRISSTVNLESTIGISPYTKLIGRYVISGLYLSDLQSSLTVRETIDLQSNLRISPFTFMRSKYNVIEPPSYTVRLYPNKDAFVREAIPRLNYGTEQQMYVGHSALPKDTFRGFIGFDLLSVSIPQVNTTIAKAELRIYFDGRNEPNKRVQVIEPHSDWAEYGITWKNQPFPYGYDSPTSSYDGINVQKSVGGDSKYVTFDVTESITKWHEGTKNNYGFIIKSLFESENHTFRFFTKEQQAFRPMLEITYYDTRIFSFGRDSTWSEMVIRQNESSDLKSSFFVRSSYGKNDLTSNLFVINPRDLFSYITVNRAEVLSGIAVRRTDIINLQSSIQVKQRGIPSEQDGTILVTKPDMPSRVYILYRDDLQSDVVVRQSGEPYPEIASAVTVNRPDNLGCIEVRRRKCIDWESAITINTPNLFGSIEVLEKTELTGSLGVRNREKYDLVAEGYLRYHESLTGRVLIHKDFIPSGMGVASISVLLSSITVSANGSVEMPSEIKIRSREDLLSHMYIPPNKDVPSEITVLSGYLASHIAVPRNSTSDKYSTLSVRVKSVSDLPSENGIRSGWLGSIIGVRVDSQEDVPSSIDINVWDFSNLEGTTTVRIWDSGDLESNIKARKHRESDLHMVFKVRLSTYSNLPSNIGTKIHGNLDSHVSVRRNEESDLSSSISVWENSTLDVSFTVRARGQSELLGQGSIRSVSQIDCTIEIVTAYPYAYIM